MSIESVRQEKAKALATLEQAARRGDGPNKFKRDDVMFAVNGDPAKIDELTAIAESARADQRERVRRLAEKDDLRAATNRVLAEWETAERAERRARAEAEAKKRLGLESS
jgi:hypothetical protein